MVKTVVDPEGEAITRTLRYVETGPNTGRLFQETHSDGSWTRYHYDSNGRIETRASAVLDADASSTEATSLAMIQRYTPVDPDDTEENRDQQIPRTLTEYTQGVVTRVTYHAFLRSDDGSRIAITEQAAPGAPYGAAENQRTVRTFYPAMTGNAAASRLHTRVEPDGRMTTYHYAAGTFDNGAVRKETITRGTTDHPAGIAFKTTRSVRFSDALDRLTAEETYVYNGSGYEPLSRVEYAYDSQGRQIRTTQSNGTHTASDWGCCGKASETDALGVSTVYRYTDLNQVETASRDSLNGVITTAFTYDAQGRQLTQTISGGSHTLRSENRYDTAGRLSQTISTQGVSYSNFGGNHFFDRQSNLYVLKSTHGYC